MSTPCEDCVKDQKKAQLIGLALGITVGVGVTFAFIKFSQR